jgi:hypothetical protein
MEDKHIMDSSIAASLREVLPSMILPNGPKIFVKVG